MTFPICGLGVAQIKATGTFTIQKKTLVFGICNDFPDKKREFQHKAATNLGALSVKRFGTKRPSASDSISRSSTFSDNSIQNEKEQFSHREKRIVSLKKSVVEEQKTESTSQQPIASKKLTEITDSKPTRKPKLNPFECMKNNDALKLFVKNVPVEANGPTASIEPSFKLAEFLGFQDSFSSSIFELLESLVFLSKTKGNDIFSTVSLARMDCESVQATFTKGILSSLSYLQSM